MLLGVLHNGIPAQSMLRVETAILLLNTHLVMYIETYFLPLPLSQGTREITRLDIMDYLDPASNSGSKPQRLGATNYKNSTSDKLQTFLLHLVNF